MNISDAERDAATPVRVKAELMARCKSAQIDIEERSGFDATDYLEVALPNGREKRRRSLYSLNSINEFLSISFERFVFLGDYEAICSYQDGSIEALVRGVGQSSTYALRRELQRATDGDVHAEHIKNALVIAQTNLENSVRLSLGNSSQPFRILSRPPASSPRAIVLNITGVTVSQHDDALRILEKVSNSLFFQIDLSTGIALSLVKDRRKGRSLRGGLKDGALCAIFPQREYDAAPMSLYWYARSAVGMPLLQFLAFYQILEFYFPIFSQIEAKQRAQALLKNPTFRVDRDADIARLLGSLQLKGRGFGEERGQLRSLVSACTDSNGLREFLMATKGRQDFFAKKNDLTERRLPLSSTDADMRNDVADLVYEIRCRVVHTKGDAADGHLDLLLPFSREADLLYPYVDLVQHIATTVLVISSRPIEI